MIGQTISHYRITGKLGEGGMGEVYRATDTNLGREAAIKVLPAEIADDAERRARFLREAKAASALNHPNVCTIYEVGETEDGRPFLAMECLHGKTLDGLAQDKPLDNDTLVEVGIQIADALDTAHRAGIIHRDIKPANMHLDDQGRVKVLDFGLAKWTTSEPATDPQGTTEDHTEPGKVMGTPSYMSPEQTRGEALDHRSDLFSLGVVLYQLTTGRLPFWGASFAETIEKISRTQPEAIARFNYEVSTELVRIIRKCLEKKREDRYQSAKELLIDLRRLGRDGDSQEIILAEKGRRGSRVAAAIGLVVVAVVLVGVWWARRGSASTASFRFGKSIAVRPFAADEEYRFVADGLGGEIAGRLNRLESLDRVPPYRSSERLRGGSVDLRSVANELEVSTILQGNVRRAAETLVISAELVDPFTDSLLWRETYEYDQVNEVPFRIYKEIAQSIAEQLDIELSQDQQAELVAEYTKSPRAWEAYLEGRHYWARRGPDLWRALHLFELALSLDSTSGRRDQSEFALAWVGLADTYLQMGAYGLLLPKEAYPKAIEYAQRALKLNPALGDAYSTLGYCQLWYEWDLEGSDRSFERAFKLNARDARAHYWYAWNLLARGHYDEAIASCETSIQLDPLSENARWHLGLANWVAGNNEEAERQFSTLVRQAPDAWLGHASLGSVLLEMGKRDDAVREMEAAVDLSGRFSWALASLGEAYATSGRADEALEIVNELNDVSRTENVNAWVIAGMHLMLGDRSTAIEKLRDAVQKKEAASTFHFYPLWRPLWTEPEFIKLVEEIGVAQYNAATGRFEVASASKETRNEATMQPPIGD